MVVKSIEEKRLNVEDNFKLKFQKELIKIASNESLYFSYFSLTNFHF